MNVAIEIKSTEGEDGENGFSVALEYGETERKIMRWISNDKDPENKADPETLKRINLLGASYAIQMGLLAILEKRVE